MTVVEGASEVEDEVLAAVGMDGAVVELGGGAFVGSCEEEGAAAAAATVVLLLLVDCVVGVVCMVGVGIFVLDLTDFTALVMFVVEGRFVEFEFGFDFDFDSTPPGFRVGTFSLSSEEELLLLLVSLSLSLDELSSLELLSLELDELDTSPSSFFFERRLRFKGSFLLVTVVGVVELVVDDGFDVVVAGRAVEVDVDVDVDGPSTLFLTLVTTPVVDLLPWSVVG